MGNLTLALVLIHTRNNVSYFMCASFVTCPFEGTEYSLQYDPFTRSWSKTESVLEEVDQLTAKMEQKTQLIESVH